MRITLPMHLLQWNHVAMHFAKVHIRNSLSIRSSSQVKGINLYVLKRDARKRFLILFFSKWLIRIHIRNSRSFNKIMK
jgi:hypothetical protein